MMIVEKDGRRTAAMVLNSAVNGVLGIVQCLIPGCEAHIVMLAEDGDPAAFINEFLTTHDCDPSRFPERLGRVRRAKLRGARRGRQ